MPDPPMPAAESGKTPAAESSSTDSAPATDASPGIKSDLAALAARFAAYGGGSFSAEFAADLAFDIVLNEIVEQASLATGATGAAIVLAREGEMVRRACSGSTTPQLGTRLEKGPSISQECMRTRRVQRCDDAQADTHADTEASRNLGVRSVMVLPLLRNEAVVGLIEVFSTRVAAFGERDERTLEALGERILQNMEDATQPLPASSEAPPLPLPSFSQVNTEADRRAINPRIAEGARRIVSGRSFDVLTGVLGFSVLICALVLGMLVRQRFASQRVPAHEHPIKAVSPGPGPSGEARQANDPANTSAAASSALPSNSHNQSSRDATPRPGELMVYENGREVFHIPASRGSAESHRAAEGAVQPASSVEPADTMELSAAAAEDGLVHRVEPDYPEEARRQGIQGAVVLEVHINPDGTVQELELISGPTLLAQAATDAVKQWRFKPHTVNGQRAEMQTVITLNFRLLQ
jgi:TonB family protein